MPARDNTAIAVGISTNRTLNLSINSSFEKIVSLLEAQKYIRFYKKREIKNI
jgi:hypothetical protein